MNILEAVKENKKHRVRPSGYAIEERKEPYRWWSVGELIRCTKKKTVAIGAHLVVSEWEAEKPKLKVVE